MKTIYIYTKLLIVAMTAMTVFASCNGDTQLAFDLEGVWQGTITGNYYYDRYHVVETDYDTEIMFQQNGFNSGGSGYEIDREYGRRSYTKSYFEWTVRNGRIYLDYDDGYRVIIRDFETYFQNGRMRFRGYFDNYDTGEQMASFSLVKVTDSNRYFEYGHSSGYYYAPEKNSPEVADSIGS